MNNLDDSNKELDFLERYLSNRNTWAILRIILTIAILFGLISFLLRISGDVFPIIDWGQSLLQNCSTELLGALVTFYVIEQVIGRRERQREKEEKRRIDQLYMTVYIRQAKSSEEQITILQEMIRSDVLRGALLSGLNLQGTDLNSVNLEGTRLGGSNLQNANLVFANLRNASLDATDLRGANLVEANLEGALLGFVLGKAILGMTRLGGTQFDTKTRLPDGEYWTPETDMTRYTDADHPNFWRSSDSRSYAYRG